MNSRIGDVDELSGIIDRQAAQARLAEWIAQREALDAKIVRQRALLDLLGPAPVVLAESETESAAPARITEPQDQPVSAVSGKEIRRMILDAMTREPAREWSVDDLRSMLEQSGIPVESAATPLRRYLYDLRKDGKITPVRTGVHRIASPGDPPEEGRLIVT